MNKEKRRIIKPQTRKKLQSTGHEDRNKENSEQARRKRAQNIALENNTSEGEISGKQRAETAHF